MGDTEDQENWAELISRMFALLTAKLEDGAAMAAECQARLLPSNFAKGRRSGRTAQRGGLCCGRRIAALRAGAQGDS